MMNTYVFEYLDENDFRKKERSVRKYNMLAYKKLTFEYYPELRKGNFIGKEVSRNEKEKTVSYELELPTDELFKKVHGPLVLHYTVYIQKAIVLLANMTPEGILDEGHRADLASYKGVEILKTNPEKDMFKINLLNQLGGSRSDINNDNFMSKSTSSENKLSSNVDRHKGVEPLSNDDRYKVIKSSSSLLEKDLNTYDRLGWSLVQVLNVGNEILLILENVK